MEQTDLEQHRKARLRRSDALTLLNDAEFQKLMDNARLVQLQLGDLLPDQDGWNLLEAGKVRLLEKFPDGEESNICSLDAPGDSWRKAWLGENTAGVVTARCSEPSVILQVQPELLRELTRTNQQFAAHLMRLQQQWEMFRFLAKVVPFSAMPGNKLHALSTYMKMLTLLPEDDLTGSEGLFVVCRGSIECSDEHGSHTLSQADHFILGDFGPFKPIPKQYRTIEPTVLIAVSSYQYKQLQSHNPDLAELLCDCIEYPMAEPQGAPTPQPSPAEPVVEDELLKPESDSFLAKVNKRLHIYPFIMQQSQMDCAVSCLAMVALYYGKRPDINDLRERAKVTIEGTSLLALAETAEQMGFIARGIRASYEGLLNARLPLICFWKQNHFIVLYEINDKQARIADPAEGLMTISREDFSKDFSKSALELVPTVDLKRAPGAKNPLTVLLPLLKPYGNEIRDVFLAGIIYQGLMIVTPFFSQTIIDRVIVHEDVSMLNMLLLGMILISCFQFALTFARGMLISTLSTKIDHALFVQFFKHLFSLPLKFFEQRSTGDILARFNENSKISAFLSGSTITVLLDALMAIVFLAVLFYYSWSFALATLVYIGLLILAVTAYTPLLRGYSNEIFKKTVENDSCVIECVQGIEKIKSAGAEHRMRWKWEILFVDKLSVCFRQQLAYNGYSQVTQLVHLIGRVGLMWLGANLVISKQFTVGQYMAANMMSGMAVDPFMRMVAIWQQLQGVNISLERLGDVFRAIPEQVGKKARLHKVQGFVEFRNVSFRYSDNASKNVLLNVSMKIQPNKMIAVVGRSGCGKTTLARLMQGLYLATSGQVLLDGVDVTQIELSDIRKSIGVVAQQETFFIGTVRENLSFYEPDAPLERVIAAAKIAGIHERIKTMGSGYDTLLSEGGMNLSGGERQRLAIARALIHDPRILIFDEATSALDSESEKHIQDCMELIRRGRTFVVMAHRLSTIKSADLIVVMEQGQIVEAGTHQALLSKKGLYYHLCSHQSI